MSLRGYWAWRQSRKPDEQGRVQRELPGFTDAEARGELLSEVVAWAMRTTVFWMLTVGCLSWWAAASARATEFAKPVRLMAGNQAIRVEAPGYAAPCLADIDGDGTKDLLVGQFNQGKIKIYRGLGNGEFAAGKWLEAEGKIAQVPGVW